MRKPVWMILAFLYPVMHNVYGHLRSGWNVLATRTDGGLYYLRINDPHGELRYALEVVESQA